MNSLKNNELNNSKTEMDIDFSNDLEINLIGKPEPNVSLEAKLSPFHNPEYTTRIIRNTDNDLDIFLKESVYEVINAHAQSDTSREVGGILLGGYYHCDRTDTSFIEISGCIEAKHTEGSGAHVTFTHETWNEINREKDEKYPELYIVGWYHTHPSFGIFLSGHDRFIQTQYFNEEWQVAYVVDPINHKRGFLRLKNGDIINCGGFYLHSPIVEQLPMVVIQQIKDAIKEAVEPQMIRQLLADVVRKTIPSVAPSIIHRWSVKNGIIIGLSVLVTGLLYWNIQSTTKLGMRTAQLQQGIKDTSTLSNQLVLRIEQFQQKIDSTPTVHYQTPPVTELSEYIVQKGDRLSNICERHYRDGTPFIYKRVAEYNRIQDGDKIYAGQRILLPSKDRLFGNK